MNCNCKHDTAEHLGSRIELVQLGVIVQHWHLQEELNSSDLTFKVSIKGRLDNKRKGEIVQPSRSSRRYLIKK